MGLIKKAELREEEETRKRRRSSPQLPKTTRSKPAVRTLPFPPGEPEEEEDDETAPEEEPEETKEDYGCL